ncbi:hypothetical protein A3C96_02755 [Candidatus Uhrbacteria bacterium RIFCSPHIGHO2_02_FULL_60_10]|uniref:Uncharacterized protein n=1 Tax=Candidatus Uhrbacteria bacterium RIFCSPHIGHO2_02_FULL_60_10 TaxID=1802392 RepID=A0A1F7U849_9BACT|nr:MAG: hypothetical protein A3C96_02755 [Candidatus Uhrbacteria bacterium RIFCSPHIGHO2_02_FULL_60_10]
MRCFPLALATMFAIFCSACKTVAPKPETGLAGQPVAPAGDVGRARVVVGLPEGSKWVAVPLGKAEANFHYAVMNEATKAFIGFKLVPANDPVLLMEMLSQSLQGRGVDCGPLTVAVDGSEAAFSMTMKAEGSPVPVMDGRISARRMPQGGSIVAHGLWPPAVAAESLRDYQLIVDRLKLD